MCLQSLSEEREQYIADLAAAKESIVEILSQRPEVERIILFGSYAAGRRDLFTDLDLVVVMESEEDFVTRTARLYPQLNLGVALDLLVYTPAEFEKMRHKNFLKHALKQSEVLYARG